MGCGVSAGFRFEREPVDAGLSDFALLEVEVHFIGVEGSRFFHKI